jgi:hypothetical protein
VIISAESHPGGGDTAFFQGDEATMLATPEMPHAIESIAILVQTFEGRVWLISKAGPRTQARTLRWLGAREFYGRTGLQPANVRFCLERAEKRSHCIALALTHFVDDRPEVHAFIHGTVDHQYLFGPQSGPAPPFTIPVPNWPEARRRIELTMRDYTRASRKARR